ncbi:hypothetical protein [Methanoculleus sp. 7T]|jgi:hypothetical protein|uniref:hypothetical protein n=1 Tax=Methanoculleus sp. 7T TaxID=2937282 RepID=UPI0020C04ED8|nr:hypothetical protein [Methanoculleus sp. 7T]MCK8518453.1 hypothetical protein [Methanoculleus sp. 7T]
MKIRNGSITVWAMLALVVLASVGAVSAAQTQSQENIEVGAEDTGDIGILGTENLGSMYTDGTANTAQVVTNGPITMPAGYNTFTASYSNENDKDNDGQGALYRLTVWDAQGVKHTEQIKVDWATSGTIEVSFDSQGSGDAQYELWCETHGWFDTTEATDTGIGDLDYI